jgi:hypothetical protein
MKRSDFLKSLGLLSGGLLLPDNPYLQTQSVKIYDNYIRALTHYDIDKVRLHIQEGDTLSLVRDQDNLYDSFAVAIHYQEWKLGYIAAYENIVMANMLDAGVSLKAYISQVDFKKPLHESIAIAIYADLIQPTEKLIDNILALQRADDAPDIYRQHDIFNT